MDNEKIMGPMEKRLYDQWSVKVLSYGDGGFRHTMNNVRPINKAEDMKGMRLRLPETAIYVDAFKAMNANPTTLAFSETFTAVEQGTVDGLELPISSFHSTGYGEICDYLSLTGHFYSPYQMDVSSLCMGKPDERRARMVRGGSKRSHGKGEGVCTGKGRRVPRTDGG